MLALAHGTIAISDLPERPSRRTLAKACDELRRMKRGDLADEVEAEFLNGRHRGKPPPAVGETRIYRVQETEGLVFVRIPTAPTLDAHRGDAIVATFERNHVRLSKAPKVLDLSALEAE
jgi:hypothetical protein